MRHLAISVTLTSCLLAASTESGRFSEGSFGAVLLDQGWEGSLKWSKQTNKKTSPVFRSQGFELNLNGKILYDLHLIKVTNLVMVSASRHTLLGRSIHQHPHAIGIFPTNSFYDYVLIQYQSPQERDELAQVAHEDIGACGAVVPLNLSAPLTDLPAAQSPIWSTVVKLPVAAKLAENVNNTNIKKSVATLEALGTRYHAGANALTAVSTVKTMWQANLPKGAAITEFSNSGAGTTQNNLILSIPGTVDNTSTVIIGAHLDSINRSDETSAPGADDDASGIATLTEMIRVIHDTGVTFSRKIEFHAYGAEEVGLLGSVQMARSYAAASRSIAGMLQIDMNAFTNSDNAGKIFVVTTDTSAVLRRGLKDILDLYLGGNYTEMILTAGTSDHKAWMNAGYHAVFPFEHPQNYNKALHTSSDKSGLLDFTLAGRFCKLALLWLSHIAGLDSAAAEYKSGLAILDGTSDDIKIAESPGEASGSRFGVAASLKAASITSCVVASATAAGCSKDPAEYTLIRSSSTKTFFSNSADLSLNDGEFHRFIAYDSSGVIVGQRTILLKKK